MRLSLSLLETEYQHCDGEATHSSLMNLKTWFFCQFMPTWGLRLSAHCAAAVWLLWKTPTLLIYSEQNRRTGLHWHQQNKCSCLLLRGSHNCASASKQGIVFDRHPTRLWMGIHPAHKSGPNGWMMTAAIRTTLFYDTACISRCYKYRTGFTVSKF